MDGSQTEPGSAPEQDRVTGLPSAPARRQRPKELQPHALTWVLERQSSPRPPESSTCRRVGALGSVHGDCHPQRLVDFQACVPSTLARAPSELLSQHQHLARQEARCQTCFCSQPAFNSVLLSEKPTEPQFPHLFSGEVSLVAVLWLGAEVAGESPPSWTESLCLCVILHPLPFPCTETRSTGQPLGKAKEPRGCVRRSPGWGMGWGSGESWSLIDL